MMDHSDADNRSFGTGSLEAGSGKTFVLVHGGFHGGWCWQAVAELLRAAGHRVYTPTQTGCGERAHLLSTTITLNTFIDDIANVLIWEDLRDVVLVGHSFGGSSISGVADRMPERIRQLVYLDAILLENGQSMFDLLSPEVVEARLKAVEASGGMGIAPPNASMFGLSDAAEQNYVQSRLTAHPLGTYTSPLDLKNPVGNGLPLVYVECTAPPFAGLQKTRDWVKAQGMRTLALKTGHDAMISAPGMLADLLIQLAS